MRAARGRRAVSVGVCRLVEALHQITGLLKFNRQKVRSRNVDAFQLNACLIAAAGCNLIGPESQAARIRLTTEKVDVVNAHENTCLIDRVGSGRGFIIGDGNRGRARRTEGYSDGIAEGDGEVFSSFGVRIIDNRNQNLFGSVTGGEPQRPQGRLVIATRGGLPGDLTALIQARTVAGCVVNGECAGGASRTRHGYGQAPDAFRSGISGRAELHGGCWCWRWSWSWCWRRRWCWCRRRCGRAHRKARGEL